MLLKDNKKLMEEWNYEKNEHLNPSNLTIGSSKKVWWKCSKGHEWQATVNSRTYMGSDALFVMVKKF